jgi:hypothetical protein
MWADAVAKIVQIERNTKYFGIYLHFRTNRTLEGTNAIDDTVDNNCDESGVINERPPNLPFSSETPL